MDASISGTSSGKEKAVVASLSCSPDGRCSDINVNGITVTYVPNFALWRRNEAKHGCRPPSKYGNASFECQNVVLTGNDASLFGTCKTTS